MIMTIRLICVKEVFNYIGLVFDMNSFESNDGASMSNGGSIVDNILINLMMWRGDQLLVILCVIILDSRKGG